MTRYGQIYVPLVNWVMMVATIGIAVGFGSSAKLAGAFGTAVSTTMLLTTVLLFDVMRERWNWSLAQAIPVAGLFLFVDIAFFCANLLKILEGGFVPLVFGAILFTIMVTWHRGIGLVRAGLAPLAERDDKVLADLRSGALPRTAGDAVFLSRGDSSVSPLMARHIALFGALPERIATLYVKFDMVARVDPQKRVTVRKVMDGFWFIEVRFGFVEVPNLLSALQDAGRQGCDIDLDHVMFYAGHDDVVRSLTAPKLSGWRRMLFAVLYRNAVRPPDRFALPRNRFIEIGRQVEL